MSFKSLNLSPEILSNLESLEYNKMTPIQAKSLPLILDGIDVIGQAKTGSGKTAAFGLGVLSNLDITSARTQALILCPTRELAEQVGKELRRLARFTQNIKILSICGGSSESLQIKSLRHGAHIIVGTPGRVLKLLKTKKIKLGALNTFVLDEADRMLDMGFTEDLKKIHSYIPRKRQSLLFSATFPPEIQKLASVLLHNAEIVQVDLTHKKSKIQQFFYQFESHQEKIKYLPKVLAEYQPLSTVIFCKTKQTVNDVTKHLNNKNIFALAIHGDHEQRKRTLALTKFSNGSCLVLVATDVAARGLDIKDLQAVINFDLSSDPEVHTHRIGRTGRQDNTGVALSFYLEHEQFLLDAIEKYQKSKINIRKLNKTYDKKRFKLKPKMTTIYISGGRKDKIRPGDIVGGIMGTSKIDASAIGDITILDTLSYVAIDSKLSDQVIKALKDGKIKKKRFKVGRA